MEQWLVNRFMRTKSAIIDELESMHLQDIGDIEYEDLVKAILEHCAEYKNADEGYPILKPETLEARRFGSYQGDMLFSFAVNSSSPYTMHVYYGSCSGCDTLQEVLYSKSGFNSFMHKEKLAGELDDNELNEYQAAREYFRRGLETLCLHLVQSCKSAEGGRS